METKEPMSCRTQVNFHTFREEVTEDLSISQKSDISLKGTDFRPVRADIRPERADFRSGRAGFMPERADSRLHLVDIWS